MSDMLVSRAYPSTIPPKRDVKPLAAMLQSLQVEFPCERGSCRPEHGRDLTPCSAGVPPPRAARLRYAE